MLAYSTPLIAYSTGSWINNAADRYIVLAIFTFRFFVNGTTILYLPLGSLIYWAIRKKLLWNSRRERAKQNEASSQPEE